MQRWNLDFIMNKFFAYLLEIDGIPSKRAIYKAIFY